MTKVAPSLLAANFMNLENEMNEVINSGADMLHVDVMDGHFVPNISFGFPILDSLTQVTNIPLDIHLMIEEPEKYIPDFTQYKPEYITIHAESTINLEIAIDMIKQFGIKVGVAIKPDTPLYMIDEYLDDIDLLLIMTVEPGFGGQSFLESVIYKIKEADEVRKERNLRFLIEVDGGINQSTGLLCKEVGADILVTGSSFFSNSNKSQFVSHLRK